MRAENLAGRFYLYDKTYDSLSAILAGWGYGDFHARRLWECLYVNLSTSIADCAYLRSDLDQQLQRFAYLNGPHCVAEARSQDDQTVKYLLRLDDGQTVETVLMRYPGRTIACISTQVGCAMGCVFCATGQMGFVRHLSPGEIVAQTMYVVRQLRKRGERLRNIVLMGMGEPLHNYEATLTALSIMMDDRGLAIAPKHITLSTVGLPDGIRRLADDAAPVNLAVSLHASSDDKRSALVPVGQRWPLAQIIDACRYYIARRGRRIFFEWALIAGANDSTDEAHELGRLLRGLDAHVNLIPLNPTDDYGGRPSDSTTVREFQAVLTAYGLPSTVRRRRGIDIKAGCGQLRAQVDGPPA
ncbi:MAG: 23S rRNA (adenine(2503)-C(2))-methyltransferase RlmN [Chloroflexota bacterium]|nr:MAG: 23S rRNA (adenine(2503)-C(2))-methyltransferase RlmN [Chloroflexota bacterium]